MKKATILLIIMILIIFCGINNGIKKENDSINELNRINMETAEQCAADMATDNNILCD